MRVDLMPQGPHFLVWENPGITRVSFVGDVNTLTLTYGFIPEPTALALLGTALVGLDFTRRPKMR